ncbi:hypothetical protein [Chitinimonas sp.]|uniref:hypothetical protein n=1 Tax=Chitinimonas sp. TaxID=1934313 RepID=UPI0035AF29B6
MFVRQSRKSISLLTVPVTIDKPVDGGRIEKHQIDVTYLIPHQDQLDEMLKGLRDGDDSVDLAAEVVKRVDKIQEEDGTRIVYSDPKGTVDSDEFIREVRDDIINVTYARAAIMRDFWKLVNGQRVGAKRGN